MEEFLPKVGELIGDPPPSVFELILEEHVKFVDPKKYNLNEKSINPANYFITSGDAVEKTKVMERDFWNFAGELRKKCYAVIAEENSCTNSRAQELYRTGVRPKEPAGLKEFESEIWKAAGACRKLLHALKKAKGTNIFLETEWDNHRLLCIPKNPRAR